MAAASCDATLARMDGLILLYYINCLLSVDACFLSKVINKPIRSVSLLTHLRFSFPLSWYLTFSVFLSQPDKAHAYRLHPHCPCPHIYAVVAGDASLSMSCPRQP